MTSDDIFSEFPILETERLYLRELTPDDAGTIYEIFSDPVVTRYYDVETFTRFDQALRLIRWCANRYKYKDGLRWGIVQRKTDILLGTCGFHNWQKSNKRAEMGYELGIKHWRKGYATEAINCILNFAFNFLDINRIEAWTMLDNSASIRVLQKAGFSQEGVLREYGLWHGQFQDVIMFSLLRREWHERSS